MLKFGNTFVNFGGTYLTGFKINYNPMDLPPNTIRVRTLDGSSPIKDSHTSYETATLVAGTNNVYDVYKSGTSFENLLYNSTNVVEVLGANTTGITKMESMFYNCNNLTSVSLFDTSSVSNMGTMFYNCNSLSSIPLFDTSTVTDMYYMFVQCTSLTTVPLFDTSNVNNMMYMFQDCTALTYVPLFNTSNLTYMNDMFYNCLNVEGGALALYQQASTQTTPPATHEYAFYHCGKNTQTGSVELAQIPNGWK